MNPLQKAAFRRKVIYLGVILGLFTLSMFWRGTIPIPLSNTARAAEAPSVVHRTADRVASRTILNQAIGLELRELEEGEQELEGSAFRLALVGSRGLVVAYLWQSAIEKQRRNDFHKMESLITMVTQLQPHFITPWIFQSWNIAYNVSVEMQGSGDMYFYIARGIELLAEGERRQGREETLPDGSKRRIGSPDMRYQIAFYYQNKFGVSDNVEVLRCLFQLSCISPDDRNPDELEPLNERGERVVDLKKFREFCEKYPHLVRRLRGDVQRVQGPDEQTRRRQAEALKCPRPTDIIQFLRDNKDVLSRYESKNRYHKPYKQFPVLPPAFAQGPEEAHPDITTDDSFTAFRAARAWYAYSLVPIPDPPTDSNGKPLPSGTPQPGEYDPVRFRIPRSPMLIIFTQGAPRAQSYQAEMEQKEGWFDDEGWRVDDPTDVPANWWFPDNPPTGGRPGVVLGGKETGAPKWSLEAWREAAKRWNAHGERWGLIVEPARRAAYERDAARRPPESAPPDVMKHWHQAATAVYFYTQNRMVTNFPYFLAAANAESRVDQLNRPITVLARKTLWQAEQARQRADKIGALALYRDGLEQWKKVLAGDAEFHRPDKHLDRTEEETYTYELAYLRLLVNDDQNTRNKASELARQTAAAISILPYHVAATAKVMDLPNVQEELKWYVAEKIISPFAQPISERDGVMDERRGGPWVHEEVKMSVRQAQGVQRKPITEQPKPAMAMGPPGSQ